MGKPRRNFTAEFKQEAVDLLRRSKKLALQVAREELGRYFTAPELRIPLRGCGV